MNILYYHWNENSSEDIKMLFDEFGYTYIEISYPITNYDNDCKFEEQLENQLTFYHFDFIFTFNYFPIISKFAQIHKLPYVSWVYDCPHLTLFSKTITNTYNYIFLFDRKMLQQVISRGAVHAFHLPLAVNTKRLSKRFTPFHEMDESSFTNEVSFVGSLYENNLYRQIKYLPDHLRGYLDGLINSQQKLWGFSLFENLLTPNIMAETNVYLNLEDNPNYIFTSKDIFMNLLNTEVTRQERIRLLKTISNRFPTSIYSASPLDVITECYPHGFISYTDEMPYIFNQSKINLNITLRSIQSGIPLRCLDIMGAGGFLLSNFQTELSEFFVPQQDFVYYESAEDLLIKIDYFLKHPAVRTEISHNGWEKIQKYFSYEAQFEKIICQLHLFRL